MTQARPSRGIGARKLRTVLTALAVVLGVALISGTYVLTDTINQAFDEHLRDRVQGHRRRRRRRRGSSAATTARPPFDASLLPKVRAGGRRGDGRRAACSATASIVGQRTARRDRHRRRPELHLVNRSPTASIRSTTSRAARPTATTRSRSTADRRRGSTARSATRVDVAGAGPDAQRTRSSASRSSATSTRSAARHRDHAAARGAEGARRQGGKVDSIYIAGGQRRGPDRSSPAVAGRCSATPCTVRDRRGAGRQGQANDIRSGLSFLQTSCSCSRASALFVGAFMIFNTFSITVAQRTRELAHAAHARRSRRQVLGSVRRSRPRGRLRARR